MTAVILAVGVLLITGGCVYGPVDRNSSPPWINKSTSTSPPLPTSWRDQGVPYDCVDTTNTTAQYIETITTCKQDQVRQLVSVTTIVDHWYLVTYRHWNSYGWYVKYCDAYFWTDTLFDDKSPVFPVADGKWTRTYNWTSYERPGMHGCGGHEPGWREHKEDRLVEEQLRTSTTTNIVPDYQTINVVTNKKRSYLVQPT